MEKGEATMYYVEASGYEAIWFDGPHALRRALGFATLARKSGLVGVLVGIGRGVQSGRLPPPRREE